MANLPPGFDPGVWGEGWEPNPYAGGIKRTTQSGVTVRAMRCTNGFIVNLPKTAIQVEGDDCETISAAFANTYAESHGGWQA